jgi:hypothetical protein
MMAHMECRNLKDILCIRCAYNNHGTHYTPYSDKIHKGGGGGGAEEEEDYVCIQRNLQNNNTLLKEFSTEKRLINTTVLLFIHIMLLRKNTIIHTVCETHIVYISCERYSNPITGLDRP